MVARTAVITTQNQIFPSSVVPGGWLWSIDGANTGEVFIGTSTTQILNFPTPGGYTIRVVRADSSGSTLGPTAETTFVAVDEGQTIAVALSVAIQ